MQESNVFYLRKNRFSNNRIYESEEYTEFDFNNNLKSDKFEELEFTNFLSSNQCKKYNLLLEICQKLYSNCKNLNKLFIPDEFDSGKHNSKRVYDIISAVNNKKIDNKQVIYKLKNKDDKEIQFYISKENSILKLYLIDIYHIVIEATNGKIGKADRKGIYKARKKCHYDIKEIQKELIKSM